MTHQDLADLHASRRGQREGTGLLGTDGVPAPRPVAFRDNACACPRMLDTVNRNDGERPEECPRGVLRVSASLHSLRRPAEPTGKDTCERASVSWPPRSPTATEDGNRAFLLHPLAPTPSPAAVPVCRRARPPPPPRPGRRAGSVSSTLGPGCGSWVSDEVRHSLPLDS